MQSLVATSGAKLYSITRASNIINSIFSVTLQSQLRGAVLR